MCGVANFMLCSNPVDHADVGYGETVGCGDPIGCGFPSGGDSMGRPDPLGCVDSMRGAVADGMGAAPIDRDDHMGGADPAGSDDPIGCGGATGCGASACCMGSHGLR